MEEQEKRDETHVEQHGDGDVNVSPPADDSPGDQQSDPERPAAPPEDVDPGGEGE